MGTELMGASRLGIEGDAGAIGCAAQYLEMGKGRFTVDGIYLLPRSIL